MLVRRERGSVRLAILVLCLGALSLASSATAQSLPPGWNTADVGSPAKAGSANYGEGFTVTGAGADIWNTADQFRYVYELVTGDVDIIARVTSLQYIHAWTKGGLMIRQSLSGNAGNAYVFVSAGKGVAFQLRPAAGKLTMQTSGGAGQAAIWLKLQRRGSTLTAFRSSTGTSWTQIGQQTLTLPGSFYVGLALTSHDPSYRASAKFENVAVIPVVAAGNQPPTVSLTGPANGTSYKTGASIAITANAKDSDGSIAQVDFYRGSTLIRSDTASPYGATWYNSTAGTHTFTAVARDNRGATTTTVPVTVTVGATTSTSNQPPVVFLTGPANGTSYAVGAAIPVTANATDSDGIARIDFYRGSTLMGSDNKSPYGVTWYNSTAGKHTFTAVARDNRGTTTTSTAVTVTVGSVSTTNKPPSVSLSSPANGAAFTAPASIAVIASASDSDGTIAKVDFYAGTKLIGSDTSSPYGTTWYNVPGGSYTLTAVAQDNKGAVTTSAARTVTVASSSTSGNKPPSVSLTAPAMGTVYSLPASVAITASASDSDGTIAKVDFYWGSTLIGSDTTSPYSTTWINIIPGAYSIIAVARDNLGATTSSAARDIVVADPLMPDHAVFTPSINHATAVDRYVLDIYLPTATPGVSNPVITQDLGKPPIVNGVCDANVLLTVLSLLPGKYKATITAVGPGGSTRSAAASFTR